MRWLAAVLLVAALAPSSASAGGLFLTDRGTRQLARGFAWVAGADDPGALWYNPAGLAWSGQQFLLEATTTFLRADFTRVDSGGNTLATVDANAQPLPIPMMGYTHPFGDFTLGVGAFAPNASLLRWPRGVTGDGARCDTPGAGDCGAAPQRYSLYSLEGSAFVNVSAALAWRPHPSFAVGLGALLMVGSFTGETATSACDGFVCTQPENPREDGSARFELPVIQPGVSLGVTYASDFVRVGASATWWPGALRGTAKLNVRLPGSPLYDDARLEGDEASLQLDLPIMVRAGVEVRPIRTLRIEAAFVYESWSMQEQATIRPDNVWIRGATGIGDYQLGDIIIPRNMKDVFSIRLGGSLDILDDRVTLSAGVNYENSSFDDSYLQPLTLDSDKFIVGLGASIRVHRNVSIDVSYGHIFLRNREVTNSRVPQPNPIRPPRSMDVPPTAGGQVYVGNGSYRMEADMFGLGIRWSPQPAPAARVDEPEEQNAPEEQDETDEEPTEVEPSSSALEAPRAEAEDPLETERDESGDSDGDGVSDARDQCEDSPAGSAVDWLGCPV